MWQLSKKDGGLSAAPRAIFPPFYASRLLFEERAECLLVGVWRRRVSAHELSRWRLLAPAADADSQTYSSAYELPPLDPLLLDAAGLCCAQPTPPRLRHEQIETARAVSNLLLCIDIFTATGHCQRQPATCAVARFSFVALLVRTHSSRALLLVRTRRCRRRRVSVRVGRRRRVRAPPAAVGSERSSLSRCASSRQMRRASCGSTRQ